jgi:hypothetical protein
MSHVNFTIAASLDQLNSRNNKQARMSISRVPKRLLNGRCHQRSTAMRFVCLVYFEPETFAALSPGEKATIGRDSMAYDKELDRRGNYIVAEALEPVQKARTTRVRQGRAMTTDGPFAETKEHLGGFILIEAADIDEALEIAAEIPLAKLGSIEVRPVMRFSQ